MDHIAYQVTVQQFYAAVARAVVHCKLAQAIGATWPLANAKAELDEAQLYLALARAELQRP